MNHERVLILIDGGNIYSALYKEKEDSLGNKLPPLLPKGFKFDYKKFCEYLANGREIIAIRYYIGVVRNTDGTPKSELMVSGQQKFLARLENAGIKIERGRVVYDHGKTREKGVDVKIAIDIVIEGYENTYDSLIIISSDSDLIPAVKYIVSKKKKVEYIGFQNHYSNALINECSTQRVLASQDLQQFELSDEEPISATNLGGNKKISNEIF